MTLAKSSCRSVKSTKAPQPPDNLDSDLPNCLSLPRVVNIIRDVKDSRNTACGHNDFCSVRLNGPIWWFILTHRYRLSLSQFTEAVMIESTTGATFAAQKQESPDAKVSCPSGCCRIIKALSILPIPIILLSS